MKESENNAGWVWITGGSQGIGKALALELARRGRKVVISARSRDKLQSVADEADKLAGRVEVAALDVTDEEAVSAALEGIEAVHGPVEVAVLNAGTHEPVSAEDFDPAVFEKLVRINFLGVANCLGPLIAKMKERRRGRIAIVASLSGYTGLPTASAYGATKAALINMAEALKVELEPSGIQVQVVNPGFVETPLTDKNRFEMPFLMPVDAAAEAFANGLEARRFEIVFPRRFAYILKVLRCLPYALRFMVTRRLIPKGASS
ncbi:MAG: SDR family NAD(P)-dependent oxidoreductase [Rhodovibrionaceae bacterium]|nr:SDR family NAD(P)-dependent oxidoreductase [Rhodovibrionaceae bacterium]